MGKHSTLCAPLAGVLLAYQEFEYIGSPFNTETHLRHVPIDICETQAECFLLPHNPQSACRSAPRPCCVTFSGTVPFNSLRQHFNCRAAQRDNSSHDSQDNIKDLSASTGLLLAPHACSFQYQHSRMPDEKYSCKEARSLGRPTGSVTSGYTVTAPRGCCASWTPS